MGLRYTYDSAGRPLGFESYAPTSQTALSSAHADYSVKLNAGEKVNSVTRQYDGFGHLVRETQFGKTLVINDDSTEVGYVHFGIVHVVQVPNEAVAGGRSGILRPEFVPIDETMKDVAGYESWSRFCLEHLDVLLAKAAALGVRIPEPATTLANRRPQTGGALLASRK